MNNKEIANTIWTQMKYIDSNLIMCMGVQGLTVIDRGLRFKVNGLSFKGLVEVTLNGGDLYDVAFITHSRKRNETAKALGVIRFDMVRNVQEVVNDVFFDGLMELLEDRVENRGGK